MFTRNRFPSAPVLVSRRHARSGRARAAVINSRISNVATGDAGIANAREMCALVARGIGARPAEVQVASTGVIDDAKFKTFGCGSAIASSSLATEWLKGKTVDQALAIKNTDIVAELSLPPVKIHCSVLAEDAIKAAIADYKKKQGEQAGAEAPQHEQPTA